MALYSNEKWNWSKHYINAKIKGLKVSSEERFCFQIKDWETIEEVNCIQWYLIKIVQDSYDHEGKKIESIKIYLAEWDDVLVLNTWFNNISRTILNSLASVESYGYLKILLYISKESYKSVYITDDWEQLKWKYPIEELKPKVVTMEKKNWEKIADTTELDDFFKSVILDINQKLSPKEEKEQVSNWNNDEDLPF